MRPGLSKPVWQLLLGALCGLAIQCTLSAAEVTALPAESDLDADAVESPREVFHSETLHGRKSYLSRLGNLAFNTPMILGASARAAGISCSTCHVNGASNPKLFIPGLSTRPGTFDTSSALFNPRTDNGVLDAVTIPSLRGDRYLSPYGHDGRTASLRDFVRNVVVNEFAGPSPADEILDALVVYIEDIDFLPNPNLEPTGRLGTGATEEQRRGEALFQRPFPRDARLSCAACHQPSAMFADHEQHDVGSGGAYKTPTLLNADFNAPYFHDGRFASFNDVIDYFDRAYGLQYTARDKSDLAAYLAAVGDGIRPIYHLTGVNTLSDINDFASVLDLAITNRDRRTLALALPALQGLVRDLQGRYPAKTADVDAERAVLRARRALDAALKVLQHIEADVAASNFGAAAMHYQDYRKLNVAALPAALQGAEPFSNFAAQR